MSGDSAQFSPSTAPKPYNHAQPHQNSAVLSPRSTAHERHDPLQSAIDRLPSETRAAIVTLISGEADSPEASTTISSQAPLFQRIDAVLRSRRRPIESASAVVANPELEVLRAEIQSLRERLPPPVSEAVGANPPPQTSNHSTQTDPDNRLNFLLEQRRFALDVLSQCRATAASFRIQHHTLATETSLALGSLKDELHSQHQLLSMALQQHQQLHRRTLEDVTRQLNQKHCDQLAELQRQHTMAESQVTQLQQQVHDSQTECHALNQLLHQERNALLTIEQQKSSVIERQSRLVAETEELRAKLRFVVQSSTKNRSLSLSHTYFCLSADSQKSRCLKRFCSVQIALASSVSRGGRSKPSYSCNPFSSRRTIVHCCHCAKLASEKFRDLADRSRSIKRIPKWCKGSYNHESMIWSRLLLKSRRCSRLWRLRMISSSCN